MTRSRRSCAATAGAACAVAAIVVVCSDGLDRGDPQVLAAAMERLSRLCHRVVWLNPHVGDGRRLPAEHARA